MMSWPHAPLRRNWLRNAAVSLLGWGVIQSPASANARTVAPLSSPRLITVGGSLTEVVFLLGAEAQLVGTDSTSLYPLAAQRTPKVGYMRQLSAEGVLSLRPSALITTSEAGPPAVMAQLRASGVPLHVVPVSYNWDEVRRKVQQVGLAAQRPVQAQALWQQLDAQWQRVQARRQAASARAEGPRVLFILAHGGSPMVSGQGTAAAAMIELSGARNALSGFNGYRPLTAEAVVSVAPDFVLTTTQGVQAMGGVERFLARPEWALLPRLRQPGALVQHEASALLGFGPRLPGVVERLQQAWGLA